MAWTTAKTLAVAAGAILVMSLGAAGVVHALSPPSPVTHPITQHPRNPTSLEGLPVLQIDVAGNKQTDTPTILHHVLVQTGQAYARDHVDADVRALAALDRFTTVHAEVLPSADPASHQLNGVFLRFVVSEQTNAPGLTVRDTQGRLLSNVDVVADGGAYKRDSHTDTHGHFPLDGIDPSARRLLLESTRSRRMGLVTLTPNATADTPIEAVCDCFAAEGTGMVIDSAGDPVPGVATFVFIQTPDGQIFHGQSGKTDTLGYFAAGLPAKTGLTAWVTLSDDPQDSNATPHVALSDTYQVEFPNLIFRTGTGVPAAAALKRVRYSGRIVDEQNHPIPNVEIDLSFPKNHMIYGAGKAMTDTDGRFSQLLPPDAERVEMRLTARDFIGFQFDHGQTTASTDALKAGTAVIVMKRGLTISGTITDATTGAPLSNALVLTGHLYSNNVYGEAIEDYTSPRTDAGGHFIATGIPAGDQRLQIIADGYAPQLLNVHLGADSTPLSIALQPGLTYTAQVVDVRAHPVAGMRISVQDWWPKLDGVDRVTLPRITTTDSDGRFTLSDLPREGKVNIILSAKKFTTMTAVWHSDVSNPSTLTLLPNPVLTGVVLDDATNKPISDFTAYPAWYIDGSPELLKFSKPKKVDSETGNFSVSIQNFVASIDNPTPLAVRIIADGYLPQFSSPVPLDGKPHPLTIRLHAASAITGTVHDSANRPAANAKLFVTGPKNYASIQGLTLNDVFVASPKDITTADDDGAFTLPAAELPFHLVALHESGYALLEGSTLTSDQAIALIPWATVEGTFTDGGKPQNGVQLSLIDPNASAIHVGTIEFHLNATTDTQGHFRFEHVPSRSFQLMKRDGGSLLPTSTLHPEPGKTLTVNIPAKQ